MIDNKGFYQFILCNLTVANIKSRRSFVLFCFVLQYRLKKLKSYLWDTFYCLNFYLKNIRCQNNLHIYIFFLTEICLFSSCCKTWLERSEYQLPDLPELINIRGRSSLVSYFKLFCMGFLVLNICIFRTQGVLVWLVSLVTALCSDCISTLEWCRTDYYRNTLELVWCKGMLFELLLSS